MRLVMIALIFLALIAAGGTAFMVKNYLASQAEAQAKLANVKVEEPTHYVLVAGENIPVGTVIHGAKIDHSNGGNCSAVSV